MTMSDHPLQLETHLTLRKQLSTVQASSVWNVFANSPPGTGISNIIKFVRARFGPGKLSSNEFIQFGFCDTGISAENIATFAGKRAQQAFNRIYNDWTWYAVTKNKLLFETLMRGGEIPCPQTVAIYDRKGRGSGAPVFSTREALAEYLADPKNHPVFCKPTTGLLSIGSFRIDGLDKDKLLVNGKHLYEVSDVCDYIHGLSKKGYLFQKVLRPHPDFETIGCSVISSLRFVVLNFEAGAQLHSAVLKLPAKGEVADNFWRKNSIIADVEIDAGQIVRAVLKTKEGIRQVTENDSAASGLLGFALPEFDQARETVLRASRILPGVKVQSWDIAVTDKGPIALEVNFGGDLNLYQLASGKGVMNKPYCDVLREAGYSGQLPN